jgi:peptidoglycan/LPS O-acetylase OafA/YrhL
MVILACLAASIILAILAWRKGWRKMALAPVLCLFIIAVIDMTLNFALSNISGFSLIVGIVCVAWTVYMVFKTPKTTTLKKLASWKPESLKPWITDTTLCLEQGAIGCHNRQTYE